MGRARGPSCIHSLPELLGRVGAALSKGREYLGRALLPTAWVLSVLGSEARAELVIEPTEDPMEMVGALIDKGITPINVSFEAGAPEWWTYYPFTTPRAQWNQGGGGPVGIFRNGPLETRFGLLVTNGNAALALPPNRSPPGTPSLEGASATLTPDFGSASSLYTDGFCDQLFQATDAKSHDVVKITIDFTLDTGYDGVSLEYAFGSEEYPDYVGQDFSDAFGFFVRPAGTNLFYNFALDPDGNPININGQYFSSSNIIKSFGPDPETESEYNGFTPRLRSSMSLASSGPANVHRLVVVVCDAGDQLLDSGVFLKAFSGCRGTGCGPITWCGDGKMQAGEQCDDGNIRSHSDGCSASCKVLPGWACTTPVSGPSICAQTCGNGRVDAPYEQCDDGNTEERDDCVACRLPTCTDSIFHEFGTQTEIDVDCGGACPPCGDQGKCETHVHCDSGYCDPVLLECDSPPPIVARDDSFGALSDRVFVIPLEDIFENDDNYDPSLFEILTQLSANGGLVSVDLEKGFAYYSPPEDFSGVDTFEYRVCSPYNGELCDTAIVSIDVNRPPSVANRTTWISVGTTSVNLSIPNIFSDPDGDGVSVPSIVAVPVSGASVTIAADGTLTLSPTAPATARTYSVSITACDSATPRACASGTWTIIANDPPTLKNLSMKVAAGQVETVPKASWFGGYGGVIGDNANDGDTDGLLPVRVNSSASGLFTSTANLSLGTCAVNAANDAISLTAPADQSGSTTCWVRVCEELPLNDLRVCSTSSIAIQVVECVEDTDCDSGVCDPTANQCVECRDTSASGLDAGCSAQNPICISGGCVPCVDLGIGLDDGCSVMLPSCEAGRCVECDLDADCDSGVCDDARDICVDCRNSAATGAVDLGCGASRPACDETEAGGPECKECLGDADCGTRACHAASDSCVTCRNSAAGGLVDRGCAIDLPICLGDGASSMCVKCSDDRAVGVDSGCIAARPACRDTDPANPVCVECEADVDCPSSLVCDASIVSCVTCTNSASGAARDSGCPVGAPICDTATSPRKCLTCIDDRGVGVIDTGCSDVKPECKVDGTSGPECVRCETNADCGSGLCVDGECRACVDDTADEVDSGCRPNAPVCDESAVASCEVCIDSSGPGMVDTGCEQAHPVCINTGDDNADLRRCARCDVDADCDSGEVCVRELDKCVSREQLLAVPDHYGTNQGVALTVGVNSGVLHNDVVPEGFIATAALIEETRPSSGEGSLVLATDGGLTFTPATGFHGTLSFDYQASVERLGSSRTTVTIVVNGAPIATDDRVSTRVGVPVRIPILENDFDPENDTLELTSVGAPLYGTAASEVSAATYEPPPGFSGEDRFEYTLCDVLGACDSAFVIVTVGDPQMPIEGRDDFAETLEDLPVLIFVSENDDDSFELSAIETEPRHGEAEVVDDRIIRYVPTRDWYGEDSFSYLTCKESRCLTLEVNVVVIPDNDVPVAYEDIAVTRMNAAILLAVADNDYDPDGDSLSLPLIERPPERGLLDVSTGGQLKYTPDDGFVGTDTMRYSICDSLGACGSAEVKIIVKSDATGIQPPVLTDDSAELPNPNYVDIHVLDNDVDPDGTFLVVTYACDPRHGSAEVLSGGRIRYRPELDFVGVESFCYVACDADDLCGVATVTVTVPAPPNVPPSALDDFVSTKIGVPVTLSPLENDMDPNGDPLVIWTVSTPPSGTATANGSDLIYLPAAEFTGEVWFTISVSDGRGGISESRVIVLILPEANSPPLAVDDERAASLTTPTALGVRSNDIDSDNDDISITWASAPRSESATGDLGSLASSEDGDIVFIPGGDLRELALAASPLRFEYEIADGRGGVSRANVLITFLDSDGDRIPDDIEKTLGTDPEDSDTDDDGLEDGDEIASGDPIRYESGEETNPLDADSDDDGLEDGTEVLGLERLDGRMTNPLACDSDDDLLCDGLEVGVTTPVAAGTSHKGNPYLGTELPRWVPDLDPMTQTEPLDDDTDDDGRLDGHEDEDGNGRWDGAVGGTGTRGAGETDPNEGDTDDDGLLDGTEVGLIGPEGQHTDPALFKPDRDPVTVTDPRDSDTDEGSVVDGLEDVNLDGAIDAGERDPNFGADDVADPRADLQVFGGAGCAGGGVPLMFVWGGFLLILRRRLRLR